MKEVFDRIP